MKKANVKLKIYRKAPPKEVLSQLAPVLYEAGIMWYDIVGCFQQILAKKGYEIFAFEPDSRETDDFHFIEIIKRGTKPQRSQGRASFKRALLKSPKPAKEPLL
jgi:hypothetical protein